MCLFKNIGCSLLLTFSTMSAANACVSMGASHTCNKDCSGWSNIWYQLCIYGETRKDNKLNNFKNTSAGKILTQGEGGTARASEITDKK